MTIYSLVVLVLFGTSLLFHVQFYLLLADLKHEKQRRKGKIYIFEGRVPKNNKERKESLPQRSVQEIAENNRMGKTRDLFKKIRDSKGTFHARMGSIKDRNSMDLTEAEGKKTGSEVKASAGNAGDLGSIPGSRRSLGEENGNPLQYSCLDNSMDGGAWWATVRGVAKSRT